MLTLYDDMEHKNVCFTDLSSGSMIQANQHVIVHDNEGIILDPGGHKVHSKLFSLMSSFMHINDLKHLFFSHQDPDIVAAANAWLMITQAKAYLPELWMRFIPHFGLDDLVMKRVTPIRDSGMTIKLGDCGLKVIPAHYLHSAGNFHVYDPVAKILYSGDLGSSFEMPYEKVSDFDAHIKHIEWFHRRYLPTNRAIRLWMKQIEKLDIEIIAPQHGAIYPDRKTSEKLLQWLGGLKCGVDEMDDNYRLPDSA